MPPLIPTCIFPPYNFIHSLTSSVSADESSEVSIGIEESPQPNFDMTNEPEHILTNDEPGVTVEPESMDIACNLPESSTLGVQTPCNENTLQQSIPADLFEPIYPGSKLTICGVYFSIMHFSHKNKLTYTAIDNLLDLIALFCPEDSKIPSSFYEFRKFFQKFSSTHEKETYCFECETSTNGSSCSTPNCSGSCGVGHMVHLSIEKSLQVIIASKQISPSMSHTV